MAQMKYGDSLFTTPPSAKVCHAHVPGRRDFLEKRRQAIKPVLQTKAFYRIQLAKKIIVVFCIKQLVECSVITVDNDNFSVDFIQGSIRF
jgi:hypothetical protein